jgi:hypothetical protein
MVFDLEAEAAQGLHGGASRIHRDDGIGEAVGLEDAARSGAGRIARPAPSRSGR